MRSHVKSIGDYKITLEYEKLLILSDYFYILFFQRNLISVVKLVKDNYITLFNASEMFLIKENIPINTIQRKTKVNDFKILFDICITHFLNSELMNFSIHI